MVDLHEVAGGGAQVELYDVAGQLEQAVAERLVVGGVPALGGAVDGLDVVDGDAEVVVAGRRQVALEQMQLRASDCEPLDRDAEVRRGDRLGAQQLDVEVGGALQIDRIDADMVDAQAHRGPPFLVRKSARVQLASPRIRGTALFVAGVLIFCDVGAIAGVGFFTTVVLLFASGFLERRASALAWALMVLASAIFADVLWQLDWEPFNRSEDYEALPQSPVVLIGLPVPMAIVAIGIGAGTLWERIRTRR